MFGAVAVAFVALRVGVAALTYYGAAGREVSSDARFYLYFAAHPAAVWTGENLRGPDHDAAVLTNYGPLLGVVLGSLAGYFGGVVDTLLSAFINIMLSIPVFPLALVLGSFLTTDLTFVVLIIGLLSWMGVARIIRAEFMSLKEREFSQAAQALGVPTGRIILRHILPNTMGPIIVAATIQVASGILLESSLSYLGYGIQPPTASWGNMLQNAQRFLRTAPEVAIYPGALISITVIAINFVGDGLRDALDPRMRL